MRLSVRASRTLRKKRSLDFSDFLYKDVGPEYEKMYVFDFWPKNLVLAILAILCQNLAILAKNGLFDTFLPNASLVLSGFHYGNCNYGILLELPSVDAGKIFFCNFFFFFGPPRSGNGTYEFTSVRACVRPSVRPN